MPPRKRAANPGSGRDRQQPAAERAAGPRRGRGRRDADAAAHGSESYRHHEAELATRPEIGTQAQFRKKKPPRTYKYDSSLSPALDWDGQNAAREVAEALIQRIRDAKTVDEAHAAADELARLSSPFLNWAGKAERLSFDVPTLPMFVHERLSTSAILETLKRHRRDQQETLDLFGDPQHSVADQVLRAYEHRDRWVNRAVLGDSLVVMNSLLEYEGLGGQVQMIYIDPPYGVKFGSNFQPFVRKRDVKHNDDKDLTREPEMVQAYRDTWELGLHSYLTYLRDRLLVARDLLTPSGTVFVQISDENLHHVREVMDEVFGTENFCCLICFRKTTGANSPQARVNVLASTNDFILWYAKNLKTIKYRQLYVEKDIRELRGYNRVESPDGTQVRDIEAAEVTNPGTIDKGWRIFQTENLTSSGHSDSLSAPFDYRGKEYRPAVGNHWKTTHAGLQLLAIAGRLTGSGNTLNYKRYLDDFPVYPLTHTWQDISVGYGGDPKSYVVQTSSQVLVS